MPFKIVRNDITRVKADAIVNTANPDPICASGTDLAIYEAAGKEQLLLGRAGIGKIARGDVAVTGAYNLNAKYIIHTVGPVWEDGKHHEFDILESCYRKSLQKAAELKCESIAFPLISTGVYGFPKDKALQIAVSVFSSFLLENDMQIILVVFDKKSFQLSAQIVGEIDSYIDANYIRESRTKEYPVHRRSAGTYNNFRTRKLLERESYEENLLANVSEDKCLYNEEETAKCSLEELCMLPADMSLEEELANVGASFHDKLFELIDAAHLDNKDVWKRANLDRKHFSKIQCDVNYHPKKKTVMALCIALKLDLEQSKDLLARADWAFSPSSKVDLTLTLYFICNQEKYSSGAFPGTVRIWRMSNMERTIRVTGKGKISVKPDTIRLRISLEDMNREYENALKQSADSTELLKDMLEKLGYDRKELKTVYFNINTEYERYQDRDNCWKSRFEGYKYTHRMKLEFPADNQRLGKVLYALAHCPVSPEFSIEYTVANPEVAKNELLGEAVKDSMKKANILAAAAGVKLGDIANIDYSWGEVELISRPLEDLSLRCCKADACEPDPYLMDIEPDDIDMTDTVTVVWNIS